MDYTIIIITCLINIFPIYKDMAQDIKNLINTNRAITQQDIQELKNIGQQLSKNSILIFAGSNKSGLSETFESHTQIKAIRNPISKTNMPPQDELLNFFDSQLKNKDFYIWLDKSSSSKNNEFFAKNFNLEKILEQQYSFNDKVSIYKINPK